MKCISSFRYIKYNPFLEFTTNNAVSKSYPIIQFKKFTTTDKNTSKECQDYFEELSEKSRILLDKIKFDESELLQNKDVVVYTRNRTCTKCNKTVKISQPEFIENACADAWRHFHKFSYVPNCPLYGVMKFKKFNKLRTEQKVVVSNE